MTVAVVIKLSTKYIFDVRGVFKLSQSYKIYNLIQKLSLIMTLFFLYEFEFINNKF